MDMAEVPIYRRDGTVRAVALVDDADYERVVQHRWRVNPQGYAVRNQRRKDAPRGKTDTLPMARFILGLEKGDERWVDHINRDRLDNRRSNLRLCDKSSSVQNRRSFAGSSSRYRGVSWRKDAQKWVARCYIDGKCHFLGYYEDEDEAGRDVADFRELYMAYATD